MEGKEENVWSSRTSTPVLTIYQKLFIVADLITNKVGLRSLSRIDNLVDGVLQSWELDQGENGCSEWLVVLVEGVDFGVVFEEGEKFDANNAVDEEGD